MFNRNEGNIVNRFFKTGQKSVFKHCRDFRENQKTE